MEDRRIFVALPIGRELAEAVAKFRWEHRELNVRWMNPAYLHLTMVPPWQCIDVDAVCGALQDETVLQVPFEVVFEHVSFGPDKLRPRLIWATGKASAAILEFARSLFAATGAPGELRKSFLLHLTIARFNSHDYRAMHIRKISEPVSWSGKLDALCLYESILKSSGAEYRELCRFRLGRK